MLWATIPFGHIRAVHQANAVLVPALGWLAYAAWEWWVFIETPEANLCVDLLVIWLLLMILMIWAMVRVCRS